MQICSAHHRAHEWSRHFQNSIDRTYYAMNIFSSVWKSITQFRVPSMRTPTITFPGASKTWSPYENQLVRAIVSLACEMTNAKEMPFSQLNDRMPISIVIVLTYCDDGLFASKNINSRIQWKFHFRWIFICMSRCEATPHRTGPPFIIFFDRVFLLFIVRFPLFRFRFSCGAYPVPLPTDFNAFFLHKTEDTHITDQTHTPVSD